MTSFVRKSNMEISNSVRLMVFLRNREDASKDNILWTISLFSEK